jgi:actin-related protein
MSQQVVIIDNGSGYIKCGLSTQEEPDIIMPSVIGKPKYQNEFFDAPYNMAEINIGKKNAKKNIKAKYKNEIIGEDALNSPSIYNLSYPINNGMVSNFDDLSEIYNYLFYKKMKIEPSDYPFLVSECLSNPMGKKEKMMEIFFENFRIPKLGMCLQTSMALKSTGRVTGLVVESGHGSTQISAIFDDYILPNSLEKSDFLSGSNLNFLIQNFLSRCKIYELDLERDFKLLNKLKESFCFISNTSTEYSVKNRFTMSKNAYNTLYQENLKSEHIYELPDGSVADLGMLPQITENMFFNPKNLGFEGDNIAELIHKSVQKADLDTRGELMKTIIFTGGNGLVRGLKDRIKNELTNLFEGANRTVGFVSTQTNPDWAVWEGSSLVCELDPGFESNFWVDKENFEEQGSRILYKMNYK